MAAKIELEDSSIVFAAFNKSAAASCGHHSQNDVPSFLGASKLQEKRPSDSSSIVAGKPSPGIDLKETETDKHSNEGSRSSSLSAKQTQDCLSDITTSFDKLKVKDEVKFGDFSSGSSTSDLEVPKVGVSPLDPESTSDQTDRGAGQRGVVMTHPHTVKKVKTSIEETDNVSVTFKLSTRNCVFQVR